MWSVFHDTLLVDAAHQTNKTWILVKDKVPGSRTAQECKERFEQLEREGKAVRYQITPPKKDESYNVKPPLAPSNYLTLQSKPNVMPLIPQMPCTRASPQNSKKKASSPKKIIAKNKMNQQQKKRMKKNASPMKKLRPVEWGRYKYPAIAPKMSKSPMKMNWGRDENINRNAFSVGYPPISKFNSSPIIHNLQFDSPLLQRSNLQSSPIRSRNSLSYQPPLRNPLKETEELNFDDLFNFDQFEKIDPSPKVAHFDDLFNNDNPTGSIVDNSCTFDELLSNANQFPYMENNSPLRHIKQQSNISVPVSNGGVLSSAKEREESNFWEDLFAESVPEDPCNSEIGTGLFPFCMDYQNPPQKGPDSPEEQELENDPNIDLKISRKYLTYSGKEVEDLFLEAEEEIKHVQLKPCQINWAGSKE
jgi:hypothetical protein